MEEAHCILRVMRRRKEHGAKAAAASIGIQRHVCTLDVARCTKQVLEVLPLAVERQVADEQHTPWVRQWCMDRWRHRRHRRLRVGPRHTRHAALWPRLRKMLRLWQRLQLLSCVELDAEHTALPCVPMQHICSALCVFHRREQHRAVPAAAAVRQELHVGAEHGAGPPK